MIIFYSKTCEGCTGNQALRRMEGECKSRGIDFMERRTILWKVFEKEAEDISNELGVKLPFFYNTETEEALEGNSFTPLETIINFIKGKDNGKDSNN